MSMTCRRKSMRFKNYDYASTGMYFVTACVKDRLKWFGDIVDGRMVFNEHGVIVRECWFDLPNHYSYVSLDAFVVMPNHIHGIIVIEVGSGLKPFPTQKRHGLPEIMRGFKTFSSRRINERSGSGTSFRWQKSYFDRIVRDSMSLGGIREYIINNPLRWGEDDENFNFRQIKG